jgi:CheY-like chemotaxis protein
MGRKILADAGYEVITVNNGSAALKKIAEHKPDLIVLDVYMPGYSGLEVCQRLKEAGETSRVPVLLTVGKLEPFKPEEAKRVRADAFIVKPFEASELLSALSKLEDKIVPRSEASKPGRFARATQAIEEGRYDKTVAVDEDSGWRNRIAFPSKKKEKEKAAQEPENGDEAGIYNAMNKDLRTVVEHKLAEPPQEAKAEEERVDLGALAPEGLPKDVTPEEIAALAAAAAQVKGKIAESHTAEPVAEPKAEHKSEAEEQAQSQAPQPVPEVVPQAATFAEQKSEEKSEEKVETKIEASAEKSGDAVQEPASIPTPGSSDVMAAIAGLESNAAQSVNSGNGSWTHISANHAANEPITMAAAAGAGNGTAASRWTAVSVALAPEEAAISLEQEMRQAYAAFAAAETAHVGQGVASTDTQSSSAAPAVPTETASHVEEPTQDSNAPVSASPAPEAVETLSAVASAATEAISAAVQELEAVAASYVAEKPNSEPEPAAAESASAVSSEAPKIEATHLDVPEVAPAEPPQPSSHEQDEPSAELPAPVATAQLEPAMIADPAVASSAQESSPDQPSEDSVPKIAASVPDQLAAEGPHPLPTAESDVAETTAAAWANWRRIRESGDSRTTSAEPSQQEKEAIAAGIQEAAAMAVAAGAEKHSDEPSAAPGSDADGIASIVDSVLADLRPKIFEEITRKMGKKK